MPSPSRIPISHGIQTIKGNANVKEEVSIEKDSKKPELNNPSKKLSKKTKKNSKSQSNVSKIPTASSESEIVPKSNRVFKKVLNDRRGISEIKRSEQNLQCQVLQLENEVKSLKENLSVTEISASRDREELILIQKNVERFEEEINQLRLSNNHLCDALERRKLDPVTENEIKFSEAFQRKVDCQKTEGIVQCDGILSCLNELDGICSDAITYLTSIDVS